MPSTRNYLRLLCAALAASQGAAWSFTAAAELRGGVSEGALVAFVLPELESCKKLEPQWDVVQQAQPAFAVDCAAEQEFCLEQDVYSHPTIRAYFPDNSFERHRGPRRADEILAFFNRVRPRTPVSTAVNDTFLASDDVTILAFLPDDAALRKRYTDVAGKYWDRYTFGLQTVDGGPPRLKCQNNPDGLAYELADLGRVSSIETFVKKCGAPLVREMSRRSETSIMQTGKSIVHYLPSSDTDKEAYVSKIRPLAKRYSEFLVFVTADAGEYPDMASSLGHEDGAKGVLSVQNSRTGEVYPMDGEVSAEGVEAFILAISKGEVRAWDGRPRERRSAEAGHDEL